MILSTSVDDGGNYVYSYYSGTSMATPHYTGIAALLWSHYPQCSNNQIRYAIAATSKDLTGGNPYANTGCDAKFGHGLIQAKAALDFLQANSCTSSSNWGTEAAKGGCYASSSSSPYGSMGVDDNNSVMNINESEEVADEKEGISYNKKGREKKNKRKPRQI